MTELRVPINDGIWVGPASITTVTLRPLDLADAPFITTMKPDVPGVLRFVERLSGIDFEDLQFLTQADFEVLALAVDAHLRAFDGQLNEKLNKYGSTPKHTAPVARRSGNGPRALYKQFAQWLNSK